MERPAPVELEKPSLLGTHKAVSSYRDFFPDDIGVPIRPLATERVTVKPDAIGVAGKHLSRLDTDLENTIRIDRLKAITRGELPPSQTDLNFYTHEPREFVHYRELCYLSGVPDDPWERHLLWNNSHTATLEDYGLVNNNLYD